MKQKHFVSTSYLGVAITFVVMAICTSVATATEPCPDLSLGASDDFGDFGECKVLIEINSTDGDIGFHFLMDGDDLDSAEIQDPNFVTIFKDEASGALLEQKLTETFAESAEPVCRNKLREEPGEEFVTLKEFLKRWTPGTYLFLGFGDDPIKGTTVLTYDLPAAPTLVDFDGSKISWDAGDDLGECATKQELDKLVMRGVLTTHPESVPVAAWEVVFEPDVGGPLGQLKFTIRVAGDIGTKEVTVPPEYLADLPPNTPAKIEVGAIGGEDNATFTEIFEICVNEGAPPGCDF